MQNLSMTLGRALLKIPIPTVISASMWPRIWSRNIPCFPGALKKVKHK